MRNRSLPILLFMITGLAVGQEQNKLIAYWNKPPRVVVPSPPPREQAAAVVFLRDASQFQVEGNDHLAQASLNKEGSISFLIVIGDRMQIILFKPHCKQEDKPDRGTFQLMKTMCGGSIYEFVKDSAAEKELLNFMRGSLESLLTKEIQAPKATAGCGDVGGDTVTALAALFGHFPSALNAR